MGVTAKSLLNSRHAKDAANDRPDRRDDAFAIK
jgi:hypothetical protein